MKKKAIYDAAIKVIARQGLENSPMADIAKEAGTGMGTIYNYFKTKEELINQLYQDLKYIERDVLSVFDRSKSVFKQFEEYYDSIVCYYRENPDIFHFLDKVHNSSIITSESRKTQYEASHMVIKVLQHGQKEGIIKNLEINELLQFIYGTGISFMRFYFRKTGQAKPDLKIYTQMVWDAISVKFPPKLPL